MPLSQFTLPGTRSIGTADPPGDMNNVVNAHAAMGASLNVLNAAFAGGADPTGVADSTAAIQAALNACPADATVTGPPGGIYKVSSAILVPPGVNWDFGGPERRPRNPFGSYTQMALTGRLVATSSFTGSAVILISDAVTQGYASVSTGQSLRGITVDATAITSGTVDGVRVFGQVQGPVFERVSVYGVSGNAGTGFNFARDTSVGTGPVAPWSIRCRHCYAYGFGGGGFFTYNATDSAFDDCEAQAIGGGNPGWLIQGGGNTTWKGCRAENNGGSGNGFVFTQTAGGTNPTGLVEGCITNLNGGAGFLVQHAGYSLTFTGCKAEGDTAAGFDIENADGLVTLAGCSVPAASAGPVNGLLVKNSAALLVIGGSYYGSTAGVGNGGGNSNCYFGPDMAALSGSSSSPALAAPPNIDLWAGSDMGYIAQAFDRVGGNTASQGVTSGTPFLIGLRVRAPAPAAGVQMRLAVNGAGLTASQNFVALYSFAGALLGSSADQSGVWNTGAPKDLAMTLTQQSAGSLNLAPGNYWVMVLSNGTTPPLFTTTGATTQSTAVANGKLGVAVARFATNGSAVTSLPASITPASNVLSQNTIWAAIY